MHAITLLTLAFLPHVLGALSPEEMRRRKASLVRKHLKRLKKIDGGVKLVGGRGEFEGNVEILHDGQWGAVCDDEWDAAEADVICRQLGHPAGVGQPTVNSHFGPAKRRYWMDNVLCAGDEEEITGCRFDGWGSNDCTATEAAGVVCGSAPANNTVKPLARAPNTLTKLPDKLLVRLQGGRVATEGRVEVRTNGGAWEVICGDGWSLLEAIIVCKQLSLGYAGDATQTDFFGGNLTKTSYSSVKCQGNEPALSECLHDQALQGSCASSDVAAVSCVSALSDLVIDHQELIQTAHLEDRQLFFLQCAMEENCLASTAYNLQKESPSWHLEPRRLLRFTARIFNAGTADFRPAIPKHLWEWHMCHMHYHSMEVFAIFDIYDRAGRRVAEGHKASFCLEDNQCLPGVKPRFACANYGDQGISVNCSDIYKYTVDCQWIDISDLEPGEYTIKVAVNPEFKIPEISFENNAAVCQFHYMETYGTVTNCSIQRP